MESLSESPLQIAGRGGVTVMLNCGITVTQMAAVPEQVLV
jgi:hypothetical protein